MSAVIAVWICPQCSRSMRSNFCPECGVARPPIQEIPVALQKLKALLAADRRTQVAAFNTANTWEAKTVDAVCGMRAYRDWTRRECEKVRTGMIASWTLRAAEAKARADAIEWAIRRLEGEAE